jgi:hypothetical protein
MCFVWVSKRTSIVYQTTLTSGVCNEEAVLFLWVRAGFVSLSDTRRQDGAFCVASPCSCLSVSHSSYYFYSVRFSSSWFYPSSFLSFTFFSVFLHLFFCILFLLFSFLFVPSSSSLPTQFPPLSSHSYSIIVPLLIFPFLPALILVICLLLSLPLPIPLFFSPSHLP